MAVGAALLRRMTFVLAGWLLPTGATEPSDLKLHKRYYAFSGGNAAEIKASVAVTGPWSGTVYAQSAIDFVPTWRPQSRDGQCRTADVHVGLRIAMELPRWTPRSATPPAVARRFMAAVEHHENGHVAIARRHAAEMARRLARLIAEDCWSLRRDASRAIADQKIRHLAAHRAFDARSWRGLKRLLD